MQLLTQAAFRSTVFEKRQQMTIIGDKIFRMKNLVSTLPRRAEKLNVTDAILGFSEIGTHVLQH